MGKLWIGGKKAATGSISVNPQMVPGVQPISIPLVLTNTPNLANVDIFVSDNSQQYSIQPQIKEVEKIVYVDRPVEVEKIVTVYNTQEVIKEVPVYVDRIVEKEVIKEIDKPTIHVQFKEKIVEVEKEVEKLVNVYKVPMWCIGVMAVEAAVVILMFVK